MSRLLKLYVILSVLLISSCQFKSKNLGGQIICNPVALNYRFQLDEPSRREAADPSIISFKGKYYMFLSKSGGYYSSYDLVDWKFITTEDLPIEEYAPTAVVIRDTVFFMGMSPKVYKSADPEKGNWKVAQDSVGVRAMDASLFLDTNNRLYLYHGLSPRLPIKGLELDPVTFKPISEQVELVSLNNNVHGWEVNGEYNNDLKKRSILEGPFVTKHDDKYYLQYSTPGTQFKSYADGMYVSDKPLGPFALAKHNPFSYKPEGFIAGAGHGSTFQDKYGNYWYAGTMSVSVKNNLERRVGMFPAFFDKDGIFYAYTGFGDFPHRVPNKRMESYHDYQPEWMLLSYHKPLKASSETAAHPKEMAVNEDVRTYWSAESGSKGEWLQIDLKNKCDIHALQINFAEEGTTLLGRSKSIYYQYIIEYSSDEKNWNVLVDKSDNLKDSPHDLIELSEKVSARYLRITNHFVPDGKFAISGFRVFGFGKDAIPKEVSDFKVMRDSHDKRKVTLSWDHNSSVMGYNIRYGIAPDKLYHNYQVLNGNTLTIHSLNSEQDYYFTIDAFNESGISKGKQIVADNTSDRILP